MIRVKLLGTAEFRFLQGAGAALRDMGALMYQAAQQLISDKDKNFSSSSYNGVSWKPYAKSTVEWKKKSGLWPAQLLIHTGTLKNRWKLDILPGPAIILSTNTPYAALQNFGGTITIPPHQVGPAKVKASHVKAFTRKNGQQVKAHDRREHNRNGYFNFSGGGERIIPPRPFLPNQKINYVHFLKALSYRFKSYGVPCVIYYDGQEIKPRGGQQNV